MNSGFFFQASKSRKSKVLRLESTPPKFNSQFAPEKIDGKGRRSCFLLEASQQ